MSPSYMITSLPKDGGFLDGLKNLTLDATGRYIQSKIPTLQEQNANVANLAAVQAQTETVRAQNQGYLQGLGLSATQLMVGAGVIGLAALYLLTRK